MTDQEQQKLFLKANSQSYSMEILMQQNAALEREIERLMAELDEATMGIQMKGYLHKWRDREISFASKWGLRYFVLQKQTISYYVDDTSNRPRRTIPLEHCIVKDEGLKRGGQYHVFSIYSMIAEDLGVDNADYDATTRKNIKSMDDSVETATLVLRLSSSNLGEARLWIDMLQQACSMTTPTIEPQPSVPHHVSFPMLPRIKSLGMEPVLNPTNLQSNNLTIDASIETWENHFNVESMSMDEYHPPNITNEDASMLSPMVLQRVKSSTEILKKSMSRPSLYVKNNGSLSPVAASDHNLAHNIQTHVHSQTQAPLAKQPVNKTSSSTSTTNTDHRKKAASHHAHGSKSKEKSGYVPRSFPASKPMHVKSHSSPLSSEVRSHEISYRGFFNLCIIIFILTHFRLIVDNTIKYGFLQEVPWNTILPIIGNTAEGSALTWDPPQVVASIASWIITILTSYGIEKVAAQGDIDERIIIAVNYLVGTLNLVVPCVWVWTSKSHPLPCMIYLFQSVVIWMKLISYAHVNRDLRVTNQIHAASKSNAATSLASATSTNSISTPVNLSRSNSKSSNDAYGQKKSNLLNLFAEIQDLEAPFLVYPQNITISNLFYFCLAPTLCYQLNYPRTKSVKMNIILSILFRLGLCSSLILIVIEQYVRPILENAVMDMKEANIMGIIFRLLKLSIPSTYVWLLSFYIYFHLWLNLLAEITRFGDREFYKDWWNSRTIESYWRLWNLPVHHWMLRHLYYPILRSGASKGVATMAVFGFSAMFHEVVISVPFRYFALHAFFGMLAQAPLVMVSKYLDRRFDNPMLGNVMFWMIFCVIGQPMGVIMYYYDFWKLSQ